MNFFTTAIIKTSTAHLLIIFLIILFSFESASRTNPAVDSLNKTSQKYLSFYELVDGEKIHWEANFDGSEITSIYKNGNRIPDELMEDYKHKVYDQLDEMSCGDRKFTFKMNDFDTNMKEFEQEMEKFGEEFSKHKEHFDLFKFNDEEFKKNMEELREKLREHDFNNFHWNFDEEEFKEQMKELEKLLPEHLLKPEDFPFYFERKKEKGDV